MKELAIIITMLICVIGIYAWRLYLDFKLIKSVHKLGTDLAVFVMKAKTEERRIREIEALKKSNCDFEVLKKTLTEIVESSKKQRDAN